MEGRGGGTTAPISLQDLRRRLYVKAKAEKDWRGVGPGGARGAQTHRGADLRGGLPRRVVWLSPEADSAAGGRPGGRGHRAEQDASDRRRPGGVLRQRAA